MDIACSKEGDAIELVAAGGLCTIKYPAQTALATVTFANSGGHSRNRTITATFNVSGLSFSRVGALCPKGTATYTGTSVLKGSKEGKPEGIYLYKEQVIDPARFEAEGYSAAVEASTSGGWSINAGSREYGCSAASAGNGVLEAASSEISEHLTKNMTCYWFGNFTVKTNGCSLTLKGVTSEPSETGTVADGTGGIACPAGKKIEFTDNQACHYEIPAQSGLNSVHFEDTGSGATRGITAKLALTKIKYTSTGAACPHGTGTFEDGGLEGTWNLTGYFLVGTEVRKDDGGNYLYYIAGEQRGLWID
jgi:hypothetical protein